MLRIVKERLHQKYRTLDYPRKDPTLSSRYLGRPVLESVHCGTCHACYAACPTGALLPAPGSEDRTPILDMGSCTFCGACRRVCPNKAFVFTGEHRMASFLREGLIVAPGTVPEAQELPEKCRMFRRSLKLRQVSAGGCNACEADCNVLGTLVYDLGRFGIDFVASPRHADALLVTGPVSDNMRRALLDTWQAMPEPRLVIAVGSCAVSGGLFGDSAQCHGGVASVLPVDMFIPGCPPNPWTILDGLLALQGVQSPQR
ncbi:MAG: 4Fe-4S dicluster domain-containing protein [Desulfovibrio sp.]|nr:4Fe-4S dicluster domain-containing protein [Desulfovibrio sp.]